MAKLDDLLKRRIKPSQLFEPKSLQTKGYSLQEIKSDIRKALLDGRLVSYAYGLYFQPSKNGKTPTSVDAIRLRYIQNEEETYGFYYGPLFLQDYLGQPIDDRQPIELVTNKATSVKKTVYMFSRRFVIRKPYVPIDKENVSALAFLTYLSATADTEIKANISVLSTYVRDQHLSSDQLTAFADKIPSKAYRKLYSSGLFRSLWKR